MDVPELFCSLCELCRLYCQRWPLSGCNEHGSIVCRTKRLIMRTLPECVQKPRSGLNWGSFWEKWWLECRTPWRSTLEKTAELEVEWSNASRFLYLFNMCLHCWHSHNLAHARGNCFQYIKKVNLVGFTPVHWCKISTTEIVTLLILCFCVSLCPNSKT